MKARSIKKNYIFNLIYNLTNLLIPLLIAPYLSRILEPDGVGIKSYTLSIVSNFILFASLGMAEYGQREIARHRENSYERSKKTYEIGILRAITTLIVLTIYIITLVLPTYNDSNNIIYGILIINIIANMLDFSWFLQGIEEFKSISVVQIISKIVMLIITFGFVKEKSDINIAILANSIALLINSILPLFVIKKYLVKVKLKELQAFKHLKESFVYFVPAIAVQIYTVLDKTMIGIITNSSYENGYYEQADKIIKILITLVTTTNSIMKSRISYLFEKNEENEIQRLITKSASLCMLIATPITFGVMSVADIFIPMFFGDGYEKAAILLMILAPLAIIIGISGLVGSHYYTPLGKRRECNRYLIIGSILNLICNLILIRYIGSIGAAISTVIAELTITILYVKGCDKNIINLKILWKLSYKYIIASVIMFILVLGLKNYVTSSNIHGLIILTGIGAITYAIMVLTLRDNYVMENVKKIKERIIK